MARSLKILLVGSGGREHALAWKLSQSPLVQMLLEISSRRRLAATFKYRFLQHPYPALKLVEQRTGSVESETRRRSKR